jgi:acetyl esterase/lipase
MCGEGLLAAPGGSRRPPGWSDRPERDREPGSPLYADPRSLPPALFIVGAEDMLLEDNERMEARWQAANGNATLLVAPDTPRAFDRFATAIARKVEAFVDQACGFRSM